MKLISAFTFFCIQLFCFQVFGELGLSIAPISDIIIKSKLTLSKTQSVSLVWYSLNDSSIKYIASPCASCEMDAVQQYAHNAYYKVTFQTGKTTNYEVKISRKEIFEKFLKVPHFEYEPILPEKVNFNPLTGELILYFKFVSGTSDQGNSLILTLDKMGKIKSAFPHFDRYICGVPPLYQSNGDILTCNGLFSKSGKLIVKYPLAPVQEVYPINDTLSLVVYDILNQRVKNYAADPDTTKPPLVPLPSDSQNIYLYGASGKYVEQFGEALIRKSSEYMPAGSMIKSLKITGFFNRYSQKLFLYKGLNPKLKIGMDIDKIKELKTKPLNAKFMAFVGRKGIYSFYFDVKANLLGYFIQIPE